MKKIQIFLLMTLVPFVAHAQFSQDRLIGKKTQDVTGRYTIDEKKNIVVSTTIENVADVEGLYEKAKNYLTEAYQETKYRILIDNPQSGIVAGQGTYLNFFTKNIVPYTYYLNANILLKFEIDRSARQVKVSVLAKEYTGSAHGGNDEEHIKDLIVDFAPLNQGNDIRRKTYSKAFPELVVRMNNTLNTVITEMNLNSAANGQSDEVDW